MWDLIIVISVCCVLVVDMVLSGPLHTDYCCLDVHDVQLGCFTALLCGYLTVTGDVSHCCCGCVQMCKAQALPRSTSE